MTVLELVDWFWQTADKALRYERVKPAVVMAMAMEALNDDNTDDKD